MTLNDMNNSIDTKLVPDTWEITWPVSKSSIKVIGVGGGGCNSVNEMCRQNIKGVDFIICNTDTQSLRMCDVPTKIVLGTKAAGLGTGMDPELGARSAEESIDKIREQLKGAEMVFITAGMGGGTGTGAAPVIARLSKEMEILTVGVVTLPFRDEKGFLKRAIKGIKELQKHVDSLILIDNQKIYRLYGEMRFEDALHKVDVVLSTAIRSITEIINTTGLMNVDFADVKRIMRNGGTAMLGIGTAEGEDRSSLAVEAAFHSPLLNDCDLKTSKGVIVNITAGMENGGLTTNEITQIADYVNNYTGEPEKFKRGLVVDEKMGNKVNVTIIATGFNLNDLPQIDEDPEEESIVLTTADNNTQPATPYIRPEGVPALILDGNTNIVDLEKQSAYKRRMALRRKKEESL